jgi:heat shock protein HslJ
MIKVQMVNKWIVLVVILLLAVACAPGAGQPGEVEETAVPAQPDITLLEQLIGTDWDLVSWEGMTILPNATPTIGFGENGLYGTTGCNGYFGSLTLDGTAVTIGEVGSTQMWCEGVMEQEQAFLQALQSAQSLTVDGETLILQTADAALTFQPPAQATLTGSQWVLGGIAQGDAVVNIWIDSDITAEFKDGNMGGSSGCNSYSASYETDGATLTLGPVISTLMACAEEERNQRESEFQTALANVAQYEIRRNTLTLMDADGNLVMTFQTQVQ